MIQCKQCEMLFEPEHPNIKYCSNVCRALGYSQQAAKKGRDYKQYRAKIRERLIAGLPWRVCPVCHDPFRPKNLRQHICSDKCRADREEAKIKEWVEKLASVENNTLINKDSLVLQAMAAAHEAAVDKKEEEEGE